MNPFQQENGAVISAVQAFLGNINDAMLAISVELLPEDCLAVHVAVSQQTVDTEELLSDAVAELDALFDGAVGIDLRLYIGEPDASWPGRNMRLIYFRAGHE